MFEFLGAKWYNWFILGLGLVFYFFSIIAYIFRSKQCHKHEVMIDRVTVLPIEQVTNTPVTAPVTTTTTAVTTTAVTPVSPVTPVTSQVQKPVRRVGVNADF
jgi:hypothetical protein